MPLPPTPSQIQAISHDDAASHANAMREWDTVRAEYLGKRVRIINGVDDGYDA